MNHLLKSTIAVALLAICTLVSAQDAKSLISKLQTAAGGWNNLYALNDVSFDFTYESPAKGAKDVSQERYIFEGEQSWALYSTHQVNLMPNTEGPVTIALVDGTPYASHDGKKISDAQTLGTAAFLRQANYFWFVMNFKLSDPGTNYEYMGTETVDGINYNKVSVSYDSDKTGKEQNDAYILYLNPTTHLVDQFFFSLPAMGVNQPVIKMMVAYKKVDGIQVPYKRTVYMPGADGKLSDQPGLIQTSTNITFNNGFKKEDFML